MDGELNTVGTVAALNGDTATVVFKRSKACGDCHACVSFGSDSAQTEIANTLGAQVGDRVAIELHSGSVIKASLILYGIPLIALLAGALLGSLISDLFTAIFGIGAACLSFIVIRLLEPRFKKRGEFNPKMIEIVGRADSDTGGEN
ncbi:MAG: SoxR reducing system RseC family protein [Clostridia bacterium]|nr:SoxR reducing system RseC family protein [Clostridia bacterium]